MLIINGLRFAPEIYFVSRNLFQDMDRFGAVAGILFFPCRRKALVNIKFRTCLPFAYILLSQILKV